jgi:hypothetical protein
VKSVDLQSRAKSFPQTFPQHLWKIAAIKRIQNEGSYADFKPDKKRFYWTLFLVVSLIPPWYHPRLCPGLWIGDHGSAILDRPVRIKDAQ